MIRKPREPPVVLVVDDERAIRALECRILVKAGYRVLEAGDGMQAMSLLEGGLHVDLLIADLEMPHLRGDEMARRIRLERPDLKVLFVTGQLYQVNDVFTGEPLLDGQAVLKKPFTAPGLLEAVSLLIFGARIAPHASSGARGTGE